MIPLIFKSSVFKASPATGLQGSGCDEFTPGRVGALVRQTVLGFISLSLSLDMSLPDCDTTSQPQLLHFGAKEVSRRGIGPEDSEDNLTWRIMGVSKYGLGFLFRVL